MRTFGSFVSGLPEDLRRFELGPGLELRGRLLFSTLAAEARSQIAALGELERKLSGLP